MKVQIGRHLIDTQRREIFLDGAPITVSTRNADLLFYLIAKDGQVVTKEELFQQVWAGRIVEESALQRAISLTRGLLGDSDHRIIRTLHGRGYMLVLPEGAVLKPPAPAQAVTVERDDATVARVPDTVDSLVGVETSRTLSQSDLHASKRRIVTLIMAIALIGVAAIAVFVWPHRTVVGPTLIVDDSVEDPAMITALVGIASAISARPVMLRSQATEAQLEGATELSARAGSLYVHGNQKDLVSAWLQAASQEAKDVPSEITRLDFAAAWLQMRRQANAGKVDVNQLVWLALVLSEQGSGSAAHMLTQWLLGATNSGQRLPAETACLWADLYLESEFTSQTDVAELKRRGLPCRLAIRRANSRLGVVEATDAPMPKQLILSLREVEFDARWRATRLGLSEALAALADAEAQMAKLNWPAAQARLALQQARLAKRSLDLEQARQHFERAATLLRKEHLDTDADRVDLQLTLLRVGRNMTPDVFTSANALKKRATDQGNQRALLFAMQVLSLQEGQDLVAGMNEQMPMIENLADREEAYEALSRTITLLRWRQRYDLVTEVVAKSSDWFQSDPSLAFQVAAEQAAVATNNGDSAAAAKANLKAETLANLPTVQMQPKLFYCLGAGSFHMIGDSARAREWLDRCYALSLPPASRCSRHFALNITIAMATQSAADQAVLRERIGLFEKDLAAPGVEANCLIAGTTAAVELMQREQFATAQSLTKKLEIAFPEPQQRKMRGSWLLLEQMRCAHLKERDCVGARVKSILGMNDIGLKMAALAEALAFKCSAETLKDAQLFLHDAAPNPGFAPLHCQVARCNGQVASCP